MNTPEYGRLVTKQEEMQYAILTELRQLNAQLSALIAAKNKPAADEPKRRAVPKLPVEEVKADERSSDDNAAGK